jgi:hypothetical protein
MSNLNQRKKRIAAIVLSTGVLATGAGIAYAWFTSTGTGDTTGTTGTRTAFTITPGTVTGGPLTPGGPSQTIPFTVTNPSTGHQNLSAVTVAVADSAGVAWTDTGGCSSVDYSVSVTTAPAYGDMAPSGTLTGTATLTMSNLSHAQDYCIGLPVPVHFSAS